MCWFVVYSLYKYVLCYFRQQEWMVAIILGLSVKKKMWKNIHLIEPGNQPPQLTENLLTKGVVLEFVKFDNKQKLMYIMSKWPNV